MINSASEILGHEVLKLNLTLQRRTPRQQLYGVPTRTPSKDSLLLTLYEHTKTGEQHIIIQQYGD